MPSRTKVGRRGSAIEAIIDFLANERWKEIDRPLGAPGRPRKSFTSGEFAAMLSLPKRTVNSAISVCRRNFTGGAKKLYIAGWDRKSGVNGDLAPRYGLGNYPDVHRPVVPRSVPAARYYRKKNRLVKLKSSDPWLRLLEGRP